ncbi:MgtC/SapB family protein [Paenibacillus cymbidii]|uniref:MgtC/SapB family protein n=1 Tax=Paenibacillus cymbidii TaxID=1639034 RepID=UPI001F41C38F|nr:MgtC/SapB family protein [Paenibacillus cymbidii]
MDPWHIDWIHMTARLMLALVLGGLIGFERERANHAAGFRTNILVCLGSALIMLLSIYGFAAFANSDIARMDPARLAAQVLPGIGFIGAGTIMRDGLTVKGLTTAASLLVVAGIGLAVGAGFYFAAILTTLLVIVSLWFLNTVEKRFFKDKRIYMMRVVMRSREQAVSSLSAIMEKHGVEIRKFSLEEEEFVDFGKLQVTFSLRFSKRAAIVAIVEEVRSLGGVAEVKVE